MNNELAFSIANLIALIGWIFLIILPNHKVTKGLVHKGTISLLLSIGYLGYAVVGISSGANVDFQSLSGVMSLFQDQNSVMAGWIHYLAFDLFVGSWVQRESVKHGIRHLLMVPCLILTFMLGPVGLLAYTLVKTVTGKSDKKTATI